MSKSVTIGVNKLLRCRCLLLSIVAVVAFAVGCAWMYLRVGELELENFRNNQLGIRLENTEFKSGYSKTWLYSFGDRAPASEWDVYVDATCLDKSRELYAVQVYLRNDWLLPRVRQSELMGVGSAKKDAKGGRRVYSSLPSNPNRLVLPYRGVASVYIVDVTDVGDFEVELGFSYLADPIFEFGTHRPHITRHYSVLIDSETRKALQARRRSRCE